MIDYLLGLWSKNKIIFFILIPLVIFAFGIKIYQEYQFGQAKRSINKTKKKSNEIKKKVAEQEKQADEHLAKADEAGDRRKARENELDLDWHKDE